MSMDIEGLVRARQREIAREVENRHIVELLPGSARHRHEWHGVAMSRAAEAHSDDPTLFRTERRLERLTWAVTGLTAVNVVLVLVNVMT